MDGGFRLKDYTKDLLTCVKRLYVAENMINKFLNSGGRLNFSIVENCLNLEGNNSIDLPPHPWLKFSKEEKKVFEQCFGKPLQIKFNAKKSWDEIKKKIIERRDLYRECLSMTKNSRFRNYKFKVKKSRRKGSR